MLYKLKFIATCDDPEQFPELIEFTAHLQRLVELAGLAMPRRWDRTEGRSIEHSMEGLSSNLVSVAFDTCINIIPHTTFTVTT